MSSRSLMNAGKRFFSSKVAPRVQTEAKSSLGGYSSNLGKSVTVFGAYGFLGRYVVAQLGAQGCDITIPYRGDDLEPRHLKLCADIGKINFVPFDPRNVDTVRRACEGSNAVINLIGKYYETKHVLPFVKNYTFENVNVEIPQMLVDICKEQGIPDFVHVGSLSSNKDSLSQWSRTKAQGEEEVRLSFPEATILRPSTMFGDEDRFLNQYAIWARSLPRFFMVNEGNTLIQPVYVDDVAKAIKDVVVTTKSQRLAKRSGPGQGILEEDDGVGETLNLAGKKVYTSKELIEFVFRTIHRPPEVLDLPFSVMKGMAFGLEQLPYPMLTVDELYRASENVMLPPNTENGLDLLGIEQQALEDTSVRFLHQFRFGGHFMEYAE